MAGPTIFDDVDKFSPDVNPDVYPDEGIFGMLLNDEEKLDWRDDGKELPNCIPPADPCMWWPLWDINDPPNDPPPVIYVGIGACMAGFRFGGKPVNLSKGPFRRSDMAANFLFFLLFVDIFRFLVWMPSFFIVNGRLTCKKMIKYLGLYNICDKMCFFWHSCRHFVKMAHSVAYEYDVIGKSLI